MGSDGASSGQIEKHGNDRQPAHERDFRRQRLVEIRCGFAELAQREAAAAEARAADARRRTEMQLGVLAEVQLAADYTASRSTKETAHSAFKVAVAAARDRLAVEAAAHRWLTEINRINSRIRVAQTRLRRERETADSLLAERDRLLVTAEAARSMADAAREACLAAQNGTLVEEAAYSEPELAKEVDAGPVLAEPPPSSDGVAAGGAAATATAGQVPQIVAAEMAAVGATPEVAVAAPVAAGERVGSGEPADGLRIDLRLRPPQVIVRLLDRDLWTLNSLVDELASGSSSARSAWKLLLSSFVDAAIAAAIDDACFDFVPGNPFWDMFTREQARDVARGLVALGYRYDGFGEFADGRVPDQRDLALAIGSAGLLPVRIRYWPKAAESAKLFGSVRVATEVFLAGHAPSLTLGELVVVLGRRAELLADLWNEWQRVRPLLLSASVA